MVVMPEPLTKVDFTNLDKVLYPERGVTKAQVIEYYIRIAPKMLGLLAKRPLSLTRFPNGVDKLGFYEKDNPIGTPPRRLTRQAPALRPGLQASD